MDWSLYLTFLVTWNLMGGCFLMILFVNWYRPFCNDNNILSPIWIYDEWELNWFGTSLVFLLINVLCPVVTLIVWSCKFIKFICTIGRRT